MSVSHIVELEGLWISLHPVYFGGNRSIKASWRQQNIDNSVQSTCTLINSTCLATHRPREGSNVSFGAYNCATADLCSRMTCKLPFVLAAPTVRRLMMDKCFSLAGIRWSIHARYRAETCEDRCCWVSRVLSTFDGDFSLLSVDRAHVLQKSCVSAKKLTILVQRSRIALQNCNSTLGHNSNKHSLQKRFQS